MSVIESKKQSDATDHDLGVVEAAASATSDVIVCGFLSVVAFIGVTEVVSVLEKIPIRIFFDPPFLNR